MSILNELRYIERQEFFNGELIAADDLQRIEQFNREMRWLHNASLHSWGVASGYAVLGKKGEREVRVGEGYAIDVTGHEIILTRPEGLPIPPVSGEPDGKSALYDLLISYPPDTQLKESETREGVCMPGDGITMPRGIVRRLERPVFCWAHLRRGQDGPTIESAALKADVEKGERIPIARVEIRNCQLYRDVTTGNRTNARPSCSPHIVSGRAEPRDWDMPALFSIQALPFFTLQATVDTSAAKFATTPKYWARVNGVQPLPLSNSLEDHFALVGQVTIQKPQPDRFQVSVLGVSDTRMDFTTDPAKSDLLADIRANWDIAWLAIED